MTDCPQETLVHRYQRLIEISRDLASTLDLDSLLARIITVARELSDCQEASILLYDELSQQLFFQTCTNLDDNPALRGMLVPLEGSIAGWVVSHREIVIVNDAPKDKRHYDNVDKSIKFSTNSLMGLPMVTNDRVIGVLEVVNKRNGNFTQDDQDILTILSTQAAIAIQNTRLFQQSDLISELVHELRTPLSSLSTISYLLKRPEVPTEQRIRLADTIYAEAQRLNEMATTFLDLARLESGRAKFHFTIFEIPPLLEECINLVRMQAEERQIELFLDVRPDMQTLEADRDKVKQVILNLLTNAIKYNRPAGCITVHASSPDKIQVSVSDTGIGIPPDAMPHMFEKFYRVRGSEKVASGTGLGLSICKKIIESLRGKIEVNSEVNVGTTFTITLPIRQSNPD
ncbi:MAG TPA: GAF domain-containing sensor histidine kinase [Anaerolineaceae bacterium]|nr:GAF domain-containing sensor histidine kinase [Anaerolineaceae bacterium]HPN52721.1 GAF domain-containing sensor histidine kinase [Anaerolineaceae bacterium]